MAGSDRMYERIDRWRRWEIVVGLCVFVALAIGAVVRGLSGDPVWGIDPRVGVDFALAPVELPEGGSVLADGGTVLAEGWFSVDLTELEFRRVQSTWRADLTIDGADCP